eukprot:30224-Pelagococcus_subviridis.AAC.3
MPVVMMSSNEHADMVMNCIRLGAEDYIIKPVTNKAVKHMWAHVWRRKQRYQMVPRFENGREVDEEREFEAAAMEELRGGVDLEAGMLPVPETEEYSSDGESDDDEARRGDAAAEFYAMEYANTSGGWEGGTDFGSGAFYTLVPIRPRWRGERRSLRTFPGASLRPPLGFNPRHRRLSTPPDAFELHPDNRLYGTTLSDVPGRGGLERERRRMPDGPPRARRPRREARESPGRDVPVRGGGGGNKREGP